METQRWPITTGSLKRWGSHLPLSPPKRVQPCLTPRFWSSGSRNVRNYISVVLSHPVCLSLRRQWHPTPILLPGESHRWRSLVGCSPWCYEELDMIELLHFHALEKEMATHSSVLAWRIPGTEEPGGLPSMGLHRVGHDWSDLAAAAAAVCLIAMRKLRS